MTDLPKGEPFNAICPDAQYHGSPHRYCACGWMEPARGSFQAHAFATGTNLDICARQAIKLVVDRARAAGFNPRHGTVTLTFEDNGVNGKWELKQ
jgi:hypothetical protein